MGDLKIDGQFLDFTDQLIAILKKHIENYRSEIYSYEFNPDEIGMRLRRGNSVMEAEKLKLNGRFLEDAFYDYLSLMKRIEGIEDEITILERQFSSDISELSNLALSLLKKDYNYFRNLEEATNVGADILLFFAENLVRPVVVKIAEETGKYVNNELWMRNFCPICHSYPAFGKIKEDDGKKLLYCSLCGTEWQFKRLKCPWCLNEDHKKLGFLSINGEEKWRIDVCEDCKGFIKTINERTNGKTYSEKISITDLYKLEVESKHLERYAVENGYQKNAN